MTAKKTAAKKPKNSFKGKKVEFIEVRDHFSTGNESLPDVNEKAYLWATGICIREDDETVTIVTSSNYFGAEDPLLSSQLDTMVFLKADIVRRITLKTL